MIAEMDDREKWDLRQENMKLRDRVAHLEAEVMVWVNKVDDIAHDWHEAEVVWNKEREQLTSQ